MSTEHKKNFFYNIQDRRYSERVMTNKNINDESQSEIFSGNESLRWPGLPVVY